MFTCWHLSGFLVSTLCFDWSLRTSFTAFYGDSWYRGQSLAWNRYRIPGTSISCTMSHTYNANGSGKFCSSSEFSFGPSISHTHLPAQGYQIQGPPYIVWHSGMGSFLPEALGQSLTFQTWACRQTYCTLKLTIGSCYIGMPTFPE